MKETFFTILTASTLGSTLAPSLSQQQAENPPLTWDIGVMSGNASFPVAKRGMQFVTNSGKPLVFNFLNHANTWDSFVQQYPYFKFIDSTIRTGLKGDNKQSRLDDVVYHTSAFNTGPSGMMFTMAEVKSRFIGDYVVLSVVGMLLNNTINFGVMYTLNITQQYANPYPFYNSTAGRIQFMSDR
ncbi:hypothetical protein S100390_v1c07610 [Spiroplasma sp. NBRC 100390]|uniref:hypothetical protein n=1 Tax=unclassified Spiroplasma TaxID=2637901 RepID=UPI00089293A1|nr:MULTISPECIES: hypothetical protein [unclassified Spiroplasma]AOX44097.1 hypothetical protein STU14_v1c07610 [Spiroplasma sp. TU-14]APE13567.1 hypothetical protein S100390_v1c07610 [Spiroplasma sp. NBRC 100390]